MASPFSEFQWWNALPGLGDDGCQNVLKGGDSNDWITADLLNVKEASVGIEADQPELASTTMQVNSLEGPTPHALCQEP